MDKPKTKVVKSKSSNSAITSKSESRKHQKKSRSNAEFQPPVERRRGAQKRGVYVEKRPSKISINETDLSPVVIPNHFVGPSSPKPIPRPSKKRFLNSVLNILSQSTTGTQFPDKDDPEKRSERTKARLKKKREDVIREDSSSSPTSLKKKQQEKTLRDKKYKSRVLNETNSDLEQLVLQSTKEITQTPSNYSEKSHIGKESESIKRTDSAPVNNQNTFNTDTVKEKKIRFLDNDPSTVIADMPKKEEKKLYNFFVDLLETTFNVYNVKTEVTRPPPPSSLNSSKVALEIDETVANKLNIQKVDDLTTSDDCKLQKTPSKQFYFIKPDDNELWDDKHLLEHFQPARTIPRRAKTMSLTRSFYKKRRLMSESFEYRKAKPIPTSTSGSLYPSSKKKTIPKKDRKKSFIKSLKEQLMMEDDLFVEPQNFYQALKMIARNKRRCQKSIHFSTATPRKSSEGDVHVCKLNRRKLLSASTKSTSKKSSYDYYPETEFIRSIRSFNTRFSDFTTSSRKNTTITITETSEKEDNPSDISIEVFGFDYETKSKKGSEEIDDKVLSSVTSIQDSNMNDALLKYSVSSVMGSHSHVSKNGLRSLSKLLE